MASLGPPTPRRHSVCILNLREALLADSRHLWDNIPRKLRHREIVYLHVGSFVLILLFVTRYM